MLLHGELAWAVSVGILAAVALRLGDKEGVFGLEGDGSCIHLQVCVFKSILRLQLRSQKSAIGWM